MFGPGSHADVICTQAIWNREVIKTSTVKSDLDVEISFGVKVIKAATIADLRAINEDLRNRATAGARPHLAALACAHHHVELTILDILSPLLHLHSVAVRTNHGGIDLDIGHRALSSKPGLLAATVLI